MSRTITFLVGARAQGEENEVEIMSGKKGWGGARGGGGGRRVDEWVVVIGRMVLVGGWGGVCAWTCRAAVEEGGAPRITHFTRQNDM